MRPGASEKRVPPVVPKKLGAVKDSLAGHSWCTFYVTDEMKIVHKPTTILTIPHLSFVAAGGLAYISPVEVSVVLSAGFSGSLKRSNQLLVAFVQPAVAFRQ